MKKLNRRMKLSAWWRPAFLAIAAQAAENPVFAEERSEPESEEKQEIRELPAVEVIGAKDTLVHVPGSAFRLDQKALYESHVFNVNEALRKIPGVNARDEEGFGMRPNIGIRGLNPTRSTKTLLLEDGLPLSYAPYGDNASYYHPPVDRFADIEVLKGPQQILFGPQTIGGTINYITPDPPLKPQGSIGFVGGNRNYYNGQINYGGYFGRVGGLFDIIHKESDGARDNTHSDINDFNIKGVYDINASNALTLRANYFQEDSQVTYSGLTDAEARNFGIRYNPFKNDRMMTDRYGTSLTHKWNFNDDIALTASAYWSHFHRDWWRQASTTTDSQCGTSFRDRRLDGMAVNPDTCASRQGRLRDYYSYGVEPRLHVKHDWFGTKSELDGGFRAHFEEQFRRQENGKSPDSRSGDLAESNERNTDAYSGFVQNRFIFGDWSLAPGVRVEHVNFERKNLWDNARKRNVNVGGKTELTEVLPAFGITYNPTESVTAFFGFHRGFAPPRVEDAISNKGNAVEVGPEKSWNYELGVRAKPARGTKLDIALFHADFEQQNAVGSIAGGSTPLAAGKALYQGIETFGRIDFGDIFRSEHNVYMQTTYTWVGDARISSAFKCLAVDGAIPSSCTNGFVKGAVEGNRMPYSPEHTLAATIGYAHPSGIDLHLETVYVGEQFSDFANSEKPIDKSGQTGKIDDYVILNLGGTYRVKPIHTDVFVSVKNLLDEIYVVDRTRGILPGAPRLVQAGFKFNF